ncbi:amidase [Microbaculum marinisediminis]|uniref:Amidase n=1 Tax=Microbaculum marinisediminis TaxID=2931392 RepID=A0AAW5QSW2_9HYPH|nr:amidase [Microbaculum sp. A6E488]MCT8970569.1 amidase [Microbaculum sp. A6E488]
MIPAHWMPRARMERVIVHWTAGGHRASEFDREHYHVLVEGDGHLVRGARSIEDNARPIRGAYAAHTRNCNTGSIGVSLCCMGGRDVRESPFHAGRWPMTAEQWSAMIRAVADLCRAYDIPVSPETVLSHAEVQPNLGIKQRGKWDITRLAFDPSIVGAKACGDRMRAGVAATLAETESERAAAVEVERRDGGTGTVTAGRLNLRNAPSGAKIGEIPQGVTLTVHHRAGDWLHVTTPAGFAGWVHGGYVDLH